jgi:O-antigen/teichoic acid export membrane protein
MYRRSMAVGGHVEPAYVQDDALYHRVVNGTVWRRRALPLYAVMLVLWVLALVVDFALFDGPSSPVQWITVGAVTSMLIFLIISELMARGERR